MTFSAHSTQCYLSVPSPERKLSYRSSHNSCPRGKGTKQLCHLGEVSTASYFGFGDTGPALPLLQRLNAERAELRHAEFRFSRAPWVWKQSKHLYWADLGYQTTQI